MFASMFMVPNLVLMDAEVIGRLHELWLNQAMERDEGAHPCTKPHFKLSF
jgi:hypothetical protein